MKIVGITACPTGIAHTYMAAEALEKAAREMGHDIKIETQGTKTENVLSEKEIRDADVVILACDKKIDLSRFNGKKTLMVGSAKAIKNARLVIEDALSGKDVELLSTTAKKSNSSGQKTGLYQHLMTGVNYMLPFVIAGGILIAISFAFGITASDPTADNYNVLAEAFSNIGGTVAFGLMVPVLAAGIAYSIAGQQGIAAGLVAGMLAKNGGSGFLGGMVGGLLAGYLVLLIVKYLKVPKSFETLASLIIVPLLSVAITGLIMVFVVGEPVAWLLAQLTNFLNGLGTTSGILFGLLIGVMMASDMGGPINKAISTFAVGLMSTGVYEPIAACMIAGMTPPLGLALATVLFPKRFTLEEREAGKSCWILGASYITEGAIPFAVTDPIRVIPSLMAGSAVAAAMSLAFGCASLAPHGGIWVMFIPNVMNNLPMYLLSLVAGTVVTALMVSFLKRKNNYATA